MEHEECERQHRFLFYLFLNKKQKEVDHGKEKIAEVTVRKTVAKKSPQITPPIWSKRAS
jgi:hypothetical protein